MNAQDGFAAMSFREIDRDLPVEASRSRAALDRARQAGWWRPARSRPEWTRSHPSPPAIAPASAPLVIARKCRCAAARAPNGVDFIDEDDAGSVLLGLRKEISHTAGAQPDEQFDEIGATDALDRHTGLPCHRTREQGFADPRWADQQHALGNMGANGQVALRLAQKFDFLSEVLLGVVDISHQGVCTG